MRLYRDKEKDQRNGFALIAALLAVLLLMSIGALALLVSGRDILISSRVVSDKKAMAEEETGIHQLMSSFDPENLRGSVAKNVQADPNDPNCQYTVTTPSVPTTGPATVPIVGYSIGGGQQWGQSRYIVEVTGTNTATGSTSQIEIGL